MADNVKALEATIETYEKRLKGMLCNQSINKFNNLDVVTAYKNLQNEKNALEVAVKTLSNESDQNSRTDAEGSEVSAIRIISLILFHLVDISDWRTKTGADDVNNWKQEERNGFSVR